jgi:hypothetical protein
VEFQKFVASNSAIIQAQARTAMDTGLRRYDELAFQLQEFLIQHTRPGCRPVSAPAVTSQRVDQLPVEAFQRGVGDLPARASLPGGAGIAKALNTRRRDREP